MDWVKRRLNLEDTEENLEFVEFFYPNQSEKSEITWSGT